jgi:nucleoid-associated protein YgaU
MATKAMEGVAQNSRLRFGSPGEVDGIQFWDLLDLPDIPEQPDDLTYRVRGGDRIDLLANVFYGDPILWWVLASANNIEIVPTELNEGSVLRVPSPRFVQLQLFRTAKGS